ncbi:MULTISPECIES: hypothetical protein [Aquitalea]|uniref:hypothetical protein n=1 Tax=Aquitalea TaxID=407217 RepID=UPI00135912D1|nr:MULTISPECIES: hypothetical protein [Aquitalea]
MAMRESVKSLRAYFVFAGTITALQGIGMAKGSNFNVIVGIFCLVQFSLAAGYLYVGLKLDKLLATSIRPIAIVLSISVSVLALVFLISLVGGFYFKYAFQLALGSVIAWYLYRNSKRLYFEEKNKLTA